MAYQEDKPVWFLSTKGTKGDRRRGNPDPVDHNDALDSGLLVGLLRGLSILMLLLRLSCLLPLMLDGTDGRLGVSVEATADTGDGSGL